jgi:hypothetical protein
VEELARIARFDRHATYRPDGTVTGVNEIAAALTRRDEEVAGLLLALRICRRDIIEYELCEEDDLLVKVMDEALAAFEQRSTEGKI